MASQYTQEEILASLQDAHRRLAERSSLKHDPIAIIGMSCCFPGGVRSPADYWQLLREGRSGIVQFSEDELEAAGEQSSAFKRPDYVRAAAVLDDIEHFDIEFFGIHPKNLELMDPQHRLLLQGVWEALEDAGYGAAENRGEVGLFGGCSINQYFLEQVLKNSDFKDVDNFQITTGNEKDYLVSKIAYLLNLKGPVVNVQSACSTSLVAIHYAVQSLRLGECDMAVAGGATIKVPHRAGYLHQADSIRSSKGECRPFDELADGTVEGNGMGLVVLKSLRNAIKDRDHIYAVIKGSAVNNDGDNKVSFAAPSVNGQEQVIVKALENAQINPETIQYFEAHGTGTKSGDPIEVAAVTKAFSRWTKKTGFCALGSVKSNLGHADAAAGVAGLMKTALSLYHKEIPPTLNFNAPNPALALANSPFHVNAKLRKWPDGSTRRAAVSAFGIGGTNSHMVLEESPEIDRPNYDRKFYLLPLSAKTALALGESERRLGEHIKNHPHIDLANIAYTLALGRKAFSHRSVIVARDAGECLAQIAAGPTVRQLHDYQDLRNLPVVFLFPGQGVELTSLGRELYESERSYRQCVDSCLAVARDRLNSSVDPYLNLPTNAVDTLSYQLCLFITEYALATMWMSLGVQPRYLVGHGLGEYAAACLSGVMTVSDALWMLAKRAELMDSMKGEDAAALEMFRKSIGHIQFKPAKIPMVLNVTGKESKEGVLSAQYWADQMTNPVRFADSIGAILQKNSAVFLEVGPGTRLSTQVHTFPSVSAKNCIASLPMSCAVPSGHFIYATLAKLWLSGVDVRWEKLYEGTGCHRVSLPTYPFVKRRYWIDKRPPAPDTAQKNISASLSFMEEAGEYCYLPVWKRAPFILETEVATSGSCLFFDDGSPLAEALKSSLSVFSITPIIVIASAQFARTGQYEYSIDPKNEADYGRLMTELVAQGLTPRMMLHLWGLARAEDVELEPANFWSLYSLIKAWTNLGISAPLHAGVLSRHVENVSGSERIIPENSLVVGACQAIQHELAHGKCQHFDIGLSANPSWQALRNVGSAIVTELLSNQRTMRVAYRDTHRWVMDLQAVKLADAAAHQGSIKEAGVYWITGGLGGIGMEIANLLTQQAHVTIILIQRSELPPRQDWNIWIHEHGELDSVSRALRRIMSLESSGSKIVVERADVTDVQAMRKLYEKTMREHGSLNGVVHAAGVPGGGLLALKSHADIRNVLGPKVLGTKALAAALGPHPQLDFFVLCSSVTALTGGPGRSDYCAANCFLDAFSAEHHRTGTRIVSINWDAWKETGMAATYARESKQRYTGTKTPNHPLLEKRMVVDDKTTVFSTRFSESEHWVARDHRIFGAPTIPGAAYIEMIVAALSSGNAGLTIHDLRFIQPLALTADGTTASMEIQAEKTGYRIRIFSGDNIASDKALLHAEAHAVLMVEESCSKVEVDSLARRLPAVDLQGFSSQSRGRQNDTPLQLGPAWNIQVVSCHASEDEFLAYLKLPEALIATAADYCLHVSLFDIATSFALRYLSQGELYLPIGYEKLQINQRMPQRIYSYVKYASAGKKAPEVIKFDIRMFDTEGSEIVSITNFAVKRVGGKVARPQSAAAAAEVNPGLVEQHQTRYGLSTRSGLRTFSKVIAAGNFPQIVVSAVPLHKVSEIASVLNSPVGANGETQLRQRPVLSTQYAAPADDMEVKLAHIWQTMLGIESVGVNDDYVELGGDSLIAIRLIDKIVMELNVSMSVVTLYERPTVRELAKFVHGSLATAAEADDENRDASLISKSHLRKEFLSRNSSRIDT